MKSKNLTIKTLMYLGVFASVIIIGIWVLQIQFFQVFYEKIVIDNLKRISNNIKKETTNIDEALFDYAYQNDICMQYYTSSSITDYNSEKKNCILNSRDKEIEEFKQSLIKESKDDYIELYVPNTKIKSIIYIIKLDDNRYVFLNTTLKDVDSTSFILKRQLIFLIIILLIVSIVISIFISKRLNKPILKIISTAKELEKGNYNVTFAKSGVAELDELSNILTVAASEMNKTEELRKDLIANVSHDLKTPLTMIKAYAEKIKDISNKNPEQMNKDLNIIIDETNRLNALVNDLLDLSKIQSGKMQLNYEEYDLIQNIHDIIKRYDIIVEKDGYNFKLDMPKKLIIRADKQKIEQVIYNLINNAIEHAENDLTIKIQVKKQMDGIKVSITNNGKGLTEEEKKLVWNRYYKKEKNHKRNVVGTGIGLSIVKEILETHNFAYGIDSKIDKYTTFYFIIKKIK